MRKAGLARGGAVAGGAGGREREGVGVVYTRQTVGWLRSRSEEGR